ncbi:MAG: hypothetical protein ACJAXT_001998 [Paracoccaceae bacterium]
MERKLNVTLPEIYPPCRPFAVIVCTNFHQESDVRHAVVHV